MQKIAIFGAGSMGRGIAQIAVQAGLEVLVFDYFEANPQLRQSAENEVWVGLFLTKGKDKKLLYKSSEEVSRVFENITWLENKAENLTRLRACDAVIEAIFEDIEAKQKLYQVIEENLSPNSSIPIYSNTSTIQIAQLAKGLKHPENFMGMHFFNPVPLMRPIELIPHDQTPSLSVLTASKFAEQLGKEPFVAPDLPGFVVNRIAIPMITSFNNELNDEDRTAFAYIDQAFTDGTWPEHPPALRIVQTMIDRAEKLVNQDQKNLRVQLSPEKIDEIMRVGINMPLGPFALKQALADGKAKGIKFVMGPGQFCDLVGIDVALDCCKMLKLQEPDQWEIPAYLEEMVKEGKRGRKTGEGFYQHGDQVDTAQVATSLLYTVVNYEGDILSSSLIRKLKNAFLDISKNKINEGVIFYIKAKGANIKEFPLGFRDAKSTKATIQEWHDLIKAIRDIQVPVIAVIHEYAFGGGYELALACDYIVAKENAMIGLPEVGLGLIPGGGGTQNLTRRVGLSESLKMICGGGKRKVSKPWVDEVTTDQWVSSDQLDKILETTTKRKREPLKYSIPEYLKALGVALRLYIGWKGKMPASITIGENLILHGNEQPLEKGLEQEQKGFLEAMATKDAEEGIRAFLEKRKPNFKGK